MKIIFILCGFVSVVSVVTITLFLVISGIPAIKEIGFVEFITGREWKSTAAEPSYGILPFILTSLYGTAGAILIGVPTGIMCAVFLSGKRKINSVIREAVNIMSGIPSVVYGLVGMIAVVPAVRKISGHPDGANLFSAIIVLAVMILPPVISVSETAIRAVPEEYRAASLSLGANDTETMFGVVLPAAKSGILTAVILGTGRAIGEAMAVMMVSGNVANMPSLFGSVRFLTTAVASEMSYSSGLQRQALFSVALVLFVFITLINILLDFMIKRKIK
jgi:phosphate transport system permease protein